MNNESIYDATEKERTVAPGETKIIKFYFEPNRLFKSIHFTNPPTKLYNELTINVSTPCIITVNLLEIVYDEVAYKNYEQMEVFANKIEGERAEVLVTISSPDVVKVDTPTIITNDNTITETTK